MNTQQRHRGCLQMFWNALGLAAITYLAWVGFTTLRERSDTQPPVVVQIGPTLLEAVKRVNKQIFIEHYNAVEVTYTEAPESWHDIARKLGIQQQFVILVRGRVPAGFDLSQLSERDIWVSQDGTRAQITLPPPTIFADNAVVDLANSRILSESDRCPNFLCSDKFDAYRNVIEPEARTRLIAAANEAKILDQASEEGKAYYEHLLNALGIAEVRVVVRGYSS
jgi:hypothetical protein